MGSSAAVGSLLLLLLAAIPAVFAKTFIVGDASGWDIGVDYTAWVSEKTFRVGDNLVFQYSPLHMVSEVDKNGFDSCDRSRAIQSYFDGNTMIALTGYGTRYFISPISNDCFSGMKVAVPVFRDSGSEELKDN